MCTFPGVGTVAFKITPFVLQVTASFYQLAISVRVTRCVLDVAEETLVVPGDDRTSPVESLVPYIMLLLVSDHYVSDNGSSKAWLQRALSVSSLTLPGLVSSQGQVWVASTSSIKGGARVLC